MKKKAAPRTAQEKLRGLVNLKSVDGGFYTQKEIAESLGISTRTLRRFKNQPGWKLAPRTLAKIAKPLAQVDKRIKRMVESGTVVKVRVYRDAKGNKKRERYFTKDKSIKLPKARVLQIPKIYEGKAGNSLNVAVNLEGQTTEEKIAYVLSAYALHYYDAWTMVVKLLKGFGSNGIGAIVKIDIDGEETQSRFITLGPFSFSTSHSNRNSISRLIEENEMSGSYVVSVSFYKNILKGRAE